ncbi:Condensin complex subunit 3 [Trichinella pseudospiralis]|uniref:Condensin complex subunit 3 n=1 Tax=Trichinella pseudospiralis TaxID=6337 RepID=A0A0V1F000_TRIPS|nr:Condensin complex subunit 3 [Trichinella pseudospiralis]
MSNRNFLLLFVFLTAQPIWVFSIGEDLLNSKTLLGLAGGFTSMFKKFPRQEIELDKVLGKWFQMYRAAVNLDQFQSTMYCHSEKTKLWGKMAFRSLKPFERHPKMDQFTLFVFDVGPIVNNSYEYIIITDANRISLSVYARDPAMFHKMYDAQVTDVLNKGGFGGYSFWNRPVAIYQGLDCIYTEEKEIFIRRSLKQAIQDKSTEASPILNSARQLFAPTMGRKRSAQLNSHSEKEEALLNRLKKLFNQAKVKSPPSVSRHLATCFYELFLQYENELFIKCMRNLLLIPLRVKEEFPAVSYVLCEVAKWMVQLYKNNKEPVKEKEFFVEILKFMLQSMKVRNKALRYRSCEFIGNLLNEMADEEIELQDFEDIFDDLLKTLFLKTIDCCGRVRLSAIRPIAKLQQPQDENCRAVGALVFLMKRDRMIEIRCQALKNIAVTKRTLPDLLERTRDIHPVMRLLAFKFIVKNIPPKFLTIKQRVLILEQGLNDKIESIREYCESTLLFEWLKCFDNNMPNMLLRLNVIGNASICQKLLTAYFKRLGIPKVLENFNIMNDEKLPKELNCENVFFWRALVQYIRQVRDIPLLESERDFYIDEILPTTTELAKYFKNFVVKMLQELEEHYSQNSSAEPEVEIHPPLSQGRYISVTDSGGCMQVEVDERNEPSSTTQFNGIHNYFANSATNTYGSPLYGSHENLKSSGQKLSGSLETVLKNDFIATQLIELLDLVDLSELAGREKLIDALQLLIRDIRDRYSMLTKLIPLYFRVVGSTSRACNWITSYIMEQYPLHDLQERQCFTFAESLSSAMILKCLYIFIATVGLLKSPRMFTPALQQLLTTLIYPSLEHPDYIIRGRAMKAMGTVSVLNKQYYETHFLMFFKAIKSDHLIVRMEALKGIFDMLVWYGPEMISQVKSNQRVGFVEDVVTTLFNVFDDRDNEVAMVLVQGFGKLLLHDRLSSTLLVKKIITLWFDCSIPENGELRKVIGHFLPFYAFCSVHHQNVIAEAFLSIVNHFDHNVMKLGSVTIEEVMYFLLKLTSLTQVVPHAVGKRELNAHKKLAVKILNELIDVPEHIYCRALCKLLPELYLKENVSREELILIQELCHKTELALTNKQCVNYVTKLVDKIQDLLACMPISEDEMSGSVTPDSQTPHSSAQADLMGSSLQVDKQTRKDGKSTTTDDNNANKSDVEMEDVDADVDFDAMRETLNDQNDPKD